MIHLLELATILVKLESIDPQETDDGRHLVLGLVTLEVPLSFSVYLHFLAKTFST
jgi:hypothetical protein